MFKEHDIAILAGAVRGDDDTNLLPGDVGCIIHIHGKGVANVVEFTAVDGKTIEIATVRPEQVRAVTATDITHARETAPTR